MQARWVLKCMILVFIGEIMVKIQQIIGIYSFLFLFCAGATQAQEKAYNQALISADN